MCVFNSMPPLLSLHAFNFACIQFVKAILLLTCTLLCLVNFSFSSLHFNSTCKWGSCYLKGNHGNHSSFVWDMFQEHKFCFTMEVISKQGLQKPFVTVCSTYFTILKTESGLFDKSVSQVSQSVNSLYFCTRLSRHKN